MLRRVILNRTDREQWKLHHSERCKLTSAYKPVNVAGYCSFWYLLLTARRFYDGNLHIVKIHERILRGIFFIYDIFHIAFIISIDG